jgi:hypothetical protein
MNSASIHAIGIVFASMFHCQAQVHDAKKNPAILNKYVTAGGSGNSAYFYGFYGRNYFVNLSTSDSVKIKRFFQGSNQLHDRSILIARISDLTQLDNLEDTVLVYGPRAMRPIVNDYVPRPPGGYAGHQRLSLFRWLGSSFINSVGYSRSRFAYGRWSIPYTMNSVESNPNALPYYMTHTNTNKYLLSTDK